MENSELKQLAVISATLYVIATVLTTELSDEGKDNIMVMLDDTIKKVMTK